VLDKEVYLDKWDGKYNGYDVQFVGTRLKSSHAKHGLIRILVGGVFSDCTFINDKEDGLIFKFWGE